jgi:glycosyltransferase involved in cell wall biosynthesis
LKVGVTPSVSVLMAVYRRDNPLHFASALDSLLPFVDRLDAVVLVADGPLTNQLETVIHKRVFALKITLVRLPQSLGLGQALNAGLNLATSDYVLRMDADDLCRPDRLEVLIQRLAEDPLLDVVGSFIAEFDSDVLRPHAERRVPLGHDEISFGMRTRCVMNHVSCLLRRRMVIDAGGYVGGMGFAEDWWLWARMLSRGARFGNVDRVLMDVRVGNGFVDRRRGWSMLRYDFMLLRLMLGINFIGWHQALFLVTMKLLQRLMPAVLLRRAYSILRHTPSAHGLMTSRKKTD